MALIVLILMWDQETMGARVARAASITYIVIAFVLLIVGLTIHWE